MGDTNEDGSWRTSVTTAIGSSIAGLFRRRRQKPIRGDSILGDDDGIDIMDMDNRIRSDFCEIEDAFGSLAWEQCVDSDLPEERRLVRVEDYPSKNVQTMNTRQHVWDKIVQVRDEQRRLGHADLYQRNWSEHHDADFSVLQFNTLAEGLSSGNSATPPFLPSNPKESAEYGGFSSVPNPETVFDFNKRKWRLLEVILGGHSENKLAATPYDILSLEEVDRFHGFFAPVLRLFGYRGMFVPKTNSPSARNGWYSDGCCLFWKDKQFELVTAQRCKYPVGTQVYLVATLRHTLTRKLLIIGVTHLKAQRSNANEAVRCCQVSELLDSVMRKKVEHGENASVLVLGDFNADPPEQVEGTESAIGRMLGSLTSTYSLDDKSFYTSAKIRGNKMSKRAIDYIFFDAGSLRCTATLGVPEEDQLEPAKLPGLRFPSDHHHIAAKFRFGNDSS